MIARRMRRYGILMVALTSAGCIQLPEPLPAQPPDGAMDAASDGGGGAGGRKMDDGGPDVDEGVDNRADAAATDEVCNGRDDDYDDSTDEGVRNDCGECGALPDEICDGFDNDCDLVIDEAAECRCAPGTEEVCGNDVGACVAGMRICSPDGQWGECSGTRPEPEVCNEIDDNCNGDTDEMVQNACGGCGALPAEVCNGEDDDCNGVIDGTVEVNDACECPPGTDRPCGTDVGVCSFGRQVCTYEGWGECEGAREAGTEICSGLDDDCDGVIDEDACECNAGDRRPCGLDVGACSAGSQGCMNGSWTVCEGEVAPVDEACNRQDDDCDGQTDEDACDCDDGRTRPCGEDEGACRAGTQTCRNGGWADCAGAVGPTEETCNNADDDCDGATDERFPTLGDNCSVGVGACRRDGRIICGPGGAGTRCDAIADDVQMEICDGVDNDCDGAVDENIPSQPCDTGDEGICAAGQSRCQAGSIRCDATEVPQNETCDRDDEDCDGRVDEGVGGGACQTGEPGRCGPGTRACINGNLPCQRNQGPIAESCNQVDDDCDGDVDEDTDGGACQTGEPGRCAGGHVQCNGGMFTCIADQGPRAESCNGQDDDCDGTTDEGIASAECDTGELGRCGPGLDQCVGGQIQCRGILQAVGEACNNIDDDCDGQTDERLGGGACNTGQPGRCAAGTEQCNGGQLSCVRNNGPTNEVCNGQDDDCDGAVDDPPVLLPVSCNTGEPGECAVGEPQCVNGAEVCNAPDGGREFCNGRDDDCDGSTDEGTDGAPCATELPGECAQGTTRCAGGELSCLSPPARFEGEPMTGTCNGRDDDCDGQVDEDFPSQRACDRGLAPYTCQDGRLLPCFDGGEPEPGPDPEPIPQ